MKPNFAKGILFFCFLAITTFISSTSLCQTNFVVKASVWKYLDNGTDQGTAWRAPAFNDVGWASGPGELGYGEGDQSTTVGFGGNVNNRFVTTYFRRTFNITGINSFSDFTFNLFRDDGAIVYVNGYEVYATNIASNSAYNTLATLCTDDGDAVQTFNLTQCNSHLVEGSNTIAVEIHQAALNSSDISFSLQVIGNPLVAGTPTLTRGPYLQMGSQTAISVRWRTSIACIGRVEVGPSFGTYTTASADETCLTTEHEVRVTGLNPDTKYFYRIGTNAPLVLQQTATNFFTTAPPANTTRKVRIVAFGDCGRASSTYQDDNLANYQAYLTTNGIDAADAWILLGDNAYFDGSDDNYRDNFFGIYGNNILRNHKLYPAPGNHDYANISGNTPSRNMPYYSIFSVPKAGEAGGVASNKPNYYSYDIGNIHFLSLDSWGKETDDGNNEMGTAGLTNLKTWINADLAANTKKWVVAYWHHPPYTKSSHNSDDITNDPELTAIRQNFITYLETRGVDMIINGHAHAYERSYLLRNFTTGWTTFTAANAASISSAKYDNTANSCPYIYNSTPANHGTVYIVAGSAGANGATNTGFGAYAMPYAVNNAGIFYFETQGNRLDAKMLRSNGTVFDQFTIMKDVASTTNYNITNGSSINLTASWPQAGSYTWTTTPGSTRTVNVTPPVNATTHYTVSDAFGCVTDQFNVTTTGTLPVSILTYEVKLNNNKVDVTWSTATEINNKLFTVERSADARNFVAVGTVNGAGNSNSVKQYSFTDLNPLMGTSYYRLSQTDMDDHTEYLRIKQIVNNTGKDFEVKAISGNNGLLTLQINSSAQTIYQLRIYDVQGRERKNEMINCGAGITKKEFILEAGVYIYEVISNKGEKISQKVIVK